MNTLELHIASSPIWPAVFTITGIVGVLILAALTGLLLINTDLTRKAKQSRMVYWAFVFALITSISTVITGTGCMLLTYDTVGDRFRNNVEAAWPGLETTDDRPEAWQTLRLTGSHPVTLSNRGQRLACSLSVKRIDHSIPLLRNGPFDWTVSLHCEQHPRAQVPVQQH